MGFVVSLTEPFLTALAQIVPLSDLEPRYLEEPRGRYQGVPAPLVKPLNAKMAADVLVLCAAHRVGVVPYAGGTGLVGGQINEASGPYILCSVEKMNTIAPADPDDRSIIVGAGAILADVQGAAEAAGLLFPLSLASEGSCRIGGLLATNAGGVNVIRYGNARDLCLGIEAALPNGTVILGLKGLRKDNTGYDLRHLLIGSEGTLGLITAARLKLVPRPVEQVTAFLDVGSPENALALLRLLQDRFGEVISAFELIDRTGVSFVEETLPQLTLPPVGPSRWHVLVELGSGEGAGLADLFEAALAEAMEAGLVIDGTLAQSDAQRAQIWGLRESIPIGNRNIGSVCSHDISVPVGKVPAFIAAGASALAEHFAELRLNSFGHLGDGNLHFNIFPPEGQSNAQHKGKAADITRMIHDLVAEFGGSFSAEHGVGRLKTDDLKRYGDPGKLVAMRAIKNALDPVGIMNPGAVFEPISKA